MSLSKNNKKIGFLTNPERYYRLTYLSPVLVNVRVIDLIIPKKVRELSEHDQEKERERRAVKAVKGCIKNHVYAI